MVVEPLDESDAHEELLSDSGAGVVDVVVGDGDSSAPAVAAVASDFTPLTEPEQAAAAAGAVPYPGSVPEDAGPSRRERRRARRRERRLARGRRLITFRTLLFVILLAAVVVGAFAAIRWYDINSYFVRAQGNELVIYQGRIGGLLWYHPREVPGGRTGVTTAASPGPSFADPTRGLITLAPCTSWSYWRMIHSLLQTLSEPRILINVS